MPQALKNRLNSVYEKRQSILKAGGTALRRVLANHVRELASTRHKTSMALGVPPSGHWKASDVGEPIVDGDSVSIPMYTPGISRALHDVTIRAKRSKNLAIPFNRLTAGLSAREYMTRHPGDLFFYLTKRKSKSLAMTKSGRLIVMYILKNPVNQRRDPTLLPEDNEMNEAFINTVARTISEIIHNG